MSVRQTGQSISQWAGVNKRTNCFIRTFLSVLLDKVQGKRRQSRAPLAACILPLTAVVRIEIAAGQRSTMRRRQTGGALARSLPY
jgi:hypothetical protein